MGTAAQREEDAGMQLVSGSPDEDGDAGGAHVDGAGRTWRPASRSGPLMAQETIWRAT